MRDLLHSVKPVRCLSPVSGAGDTTAQVGEIVDGQGYAGVLYVIALGAIADTDATWTVLLEESDDSGMSGAVAVADSSMISMTAGTAPETAAAFQFDSDNGIRYLDYIGTKRYTRLTMTPAANTGAWLVSSVAVKYGARHNPAGATQLP
jgi:hypothetical protein